MSSKNTDIAIIGAGISGSFIAGELHDAGFHCVLLEKSRGLGGRCSRRYIDDNYSIDLGAPEFLLKGIDNPKLKSHINTWIEKGYLDSWVYQMNRFNGNDQSEIIESLCATPSMNAWHKHIASQVNVLKGRKVDSLAKVGDSWHLFDESGQQVLSAKRLIITAPAEQSLALLKLHNISSDIRLVNDNSLPQFVCAIGLTQASNLKADVYREGHGVLAAAIRENSKPGRTLPHSMKEVWLLHSTYEWAQQHASDNHQQAAEILISEFSQQFGLDTPPLFLSSHFWRLARHRINTPTGTPFIWNNEMQIGCCGDWLSTGDIAGALTSAVSLFEDITSA